MVVLETRGLVVEGTSSSGNDFLKPWKRVKRHRKGTLQPWETPSSVPAANGEWDSTSPSFTSSHANIDIQISNCSFSKHVTLQTAGTLVAMNPTSHLQNVSLLSSARGAVPATSFGRSCIPVLAERCGGERYPQYFPERYSLFDTSLPFSFLLATKFIFQSWQALVMHKSSPLSNHFHQPSMNFLYFSCTFFEMEMNTAFKAKAYHPFM